jgi:hypothetical protein
VTGLSLPVLSLALGCASQTATQAPKAPTASRSTLATLPLRTVGIDETLAQKTRARIEKQAVLKVIPLSARRVDQALSRLPSCQKQQGSKPRSRECLEQLREKTHADWLLSGALGRLGETTLVQLRLDSKKGPPKTVEKSFQLSPEKLPAAVAKLALELLPPAPSKPRVAPLTPPPRIWLWALIAAGVAAAVAVPIVLTTTPGSEPPADTAIVVPLP